MYLRPVHRADCNEYLAEYLKREGFIKSQRIFDLMYRVDRRKYVNTKYTSSLSAYDDSAQNLGHGRKMCAPHMHANVLEILNDKLTSGSKVFCLRCSSGYLLTCMALLVGPKGMVVHVESNQEVYKKLKENIQKHNPDLLSSNRIKLLLGDEFLEYHPEAPYDVIYFGDAVSDVSENIFKQLNIDGSLLVPLMEYKGGVMSQMLTLFKRNSFSEDGITKKALIPVRYGILYDNTPAVNRQAKNSGSTPVNKQAKNSDKLINKNEIMDKLTQVFQSRLDDEISDLKRILVEKINDQPRLIAKELSILKTSIEDKLAEQIIEKLEQHDLLLWNKLQKAMICSKDEEAKVVQRKNKKNNAYLLYCIIIMLLVILLLL